MTLQNSFRIQNQYIYIHIMSPCESLVDPHCIVGENVVVQCTHFVTKFKLYIHFPYESLKRSYATQFLCWCLWLCICATVFVVIVVFVGTCFDVYRLVVTMYSESNDPIHLEGQNRFVHWWTCVNKGAGITIYYTYTCTFSEMLT